MCIVILVLKTGEEEQTHRRRRRLHEYHKDSNPRGSVIGCYWGQIHEFWKIYIQVSKQFFQKSKIVGETCVHFWGSFVPAAYIGINFSDSEYAKHVGL